MRPQLSARITNNSRGDDQHGTLIHGNLIYHLGGAAIGIANYGINDITNNIITSPLSPTTRRG